MHKSRSCNNNLVIFMSMAESDSEVKLSLKIMVDTKAKKVIFAEAGKDFVDFIFYILSLPLATVVKVLDDNKKGMTGSLRDLYKSIKSLDDDYLEEDLDKSSVLVPQTAVVVPLLSPNTTSNRLKYYLCDANYCNQENLSDREGCKCPVPYFLGHKMTVPRTLTYVPKTSEYGTPGYVKSLLRYIVTDNLEVKPMSTTLIVSLVKSSKSLVEKEVQLGSQEGVEMLKASLATKSVLTTVFLRTKFKRIEFAK